MLKLQAERDYFISNKELVNLEKKNASIKEKILLLKESLLKKNKIEKVPFLNIKISIFC